ncbi:hypothetical protein COY16_05005 [Candidatus Roizmanbacteria bacterium CG_4_10_14_0_2_um_filter_39_13]|uniref:Uncharacterized protein n=1 Tax=Candidatus Roizmanbacteria bacterium CG_4_10_14_0_2_um_filter_39_13 TaxID=1974825 RepID=A0A2M7TWK4_9BACT|nr:MAG: hypothetical protein COY16_05005 [Candidatus Roizmanbacteria bacterium CG_4_10_14_0_2_um_filter_39_13]
MDNTQIFKKLNKDKFYLLLFSLFIGGILYYIFVFRIQEIKLRCWEITKEVSLTGRMFPSNKAYDRCIKDLGIE